MGCGEAETGRKGFGREIGYLVHATMNSSVFSLAFVLVLMPVES